jgi:protein-S-isoprenylcysteine O-methyltransferase Ste14
MVNLSPNNVLQSMWIVWLGSWLAASVWSSRTERRPNTRSQSIYRGFTTAGAILLFGKYPDWASIQAEIWRPGNGVASVLVAVALCGFAFTWWARITLGRLWSSDVTRKIDHEVITAGPYGLVRHPIYSGIILSVLATVAMRTTGAACLGAASIVLGLFIKARMEEHFLRSELGAERYDSYARRVPMLVPFLR